ncbi:uncharacterized protein LOC115694947 [Cannabis sativa]|uniref:uncharacterized protein LOC115694947 n=1 Tax=Cannabis sativa TaxID=3483 RepID=UPI0029CA10A5|nr:uncharacterized protein LOC115694947 [Cannabis sativa]
METDTLAWDVDLVHDMFNERDANLILSISLSSSRLCDVLYWSWESSGHFSVKSVYKFLQLSKELGAQDDNSVFWNTLWKLSVPLKVKDLLLRATTNCLPTKSRLRSRHMPVETICPVSKVTDETIYHCLVDWSFAKACWQQLAASVNLTAVCSFANWFATVLQQTDGEKRRLIAMTCWEIWKHRNELVWSDKSPTGASVAHLAQALFADWTRAQDSTFNPTTAFLTDVDGAETWAKQGGNTLKINVDVAIFLGTATYSFAGVIKDETGTLVEAFTCCRSGVLQPEMVEALGVKCLESLRRFGNDLVEL